MKEHSFVFLDNPGIANPGAGGFVRNDRTLEHIVRSELKQPVVYAAPDNVSELLNEIDRRDLGDVRWSKKRELTMGWLNALYRDIQIGDLIVVPGPGYVRDEENNWTKARTLIGEVVGEPERLTERAPPNVLAGRYLIRRVKWLAEIDELELDRRTAVSLRTQNALVAINARSFEPALGAAYKNVVIGDEFLARFVTANPDFTAFECFHFTAFAMAVVGAMRQIESGEGRFPEGESIYTIAASVQKGDAFVPEQEASIHSPGYTTLRGRLLVPAVISALFALALQGDAQPFDEDGRADVSVVNSESAAYDPCAVGIEESVRQSLEIIGLERWQEMCQAASKSNDDEGLRSITTVETDGEQ